LNRRRFVLRAAGAFGSGLLLPHARPVASELPAGARASELLDALPGKRPLIKRTFRPPNYETPVALFADPLTPNDAFYVRWHMGVPDVDPRSWRLKIDGPAARTSRELGMKDLHRLPRHEVVAVNQCSGNRRGLFEPHVPGVQWGYGAMGNARWTGARLKDVLESAGVAAGAIEVVADGADVPTLSGPDFAKSLPMWKALDPDTLVAWEMNGKPLPRWNGAPARLVVPGWTATYWVKAITRLSLLDKPFDGFWMKSAYRVPRGLFGPSRFDTQDNEQTSPITDILVNSLVIAPPAGTALPVGRRTEVRGIAWDGGSGIRRVEVSLDGGKSRHEAALDEDLGRYAWRPWRFGVTPAHAGDVIVLARAIAGDGSTQAEMLIANPAGYHHNVVQRVAFRAA
jgi:DMSO/TMAO reductase YedYZ molybdopterin-dependent catalytic subunit